MTAKTIGVLGVGAIGNGVATRLLNCNRSVVLYDVNPQNIDKLVEKGGKKAGSIRELTEAADVIITSLPNPDIVNKAFLSEDGVFSYIKPGTTIIELSTIDPATMKNIGKVAAEKEAFVIDAPISGSPKEAGEGQLVLMVAGDKEVVDNNVELLEQIGKSYRYVGELGAAKTIKLVNNVMAMGNVMVAAEAFIMGVKAGVEPGLLFDVLSVSGGRSHHLLKRFPNALARDFSLGFSVDLCEKDLRLALDMAKQVGSSLPVAALVQQLYKAFSLEGHGGEDVVAIVKMFEKWANVEAKVEKE